MHLPKINNSNCMKIRIITIGDEILIGQIVDTNSAWMASIFTESGFEISSIKSVGDTSSEIKKAIDEGFEEADIVLLTGGIGPTKDDITKNTLTEYFHTDLIFDEAVLENIQKLFTHKNYSLNELTRKQALVPRNSIVIQNRVGTAPILWFNRGEKVLVSMPGVPFEMKQAVTSEILPRLNAQFKGEQLFKHHFLVSGITESSLAALLSDFEDHLPAGFSLAYLPSYGVIRLRLSARGADNEKNLSVQAQKLKHLTEDYLVDDSEKSIEAILGHILKEKSLTISTAESCTGGFIAHKIISVSGASAYFQGSIISYSNRIKTLSLDVSSDDIETFGAVSREVVEQMAVHVAEKMGTDCSIAVSGIMGPDGGTPEKPVGTVWIGTCYRGKIYSKVYRMGTSREENIARATNTAMLQMIKMIKQ